MEEFLPLRKERVRTMKGHIFPSCGERERTQEENGGGGH